MKYLQAGPEFVDDYERPELEKYEKVTPTPKDKRRPSDTQVNFITSNLNTTKCNTNFMTFIFVKMRLRQFSEQDDADIMKGKIKPKEKEPEPEMPALRKRPVTKDKVH